MPTYKKHDPITIIDGEFNGSTGAFNEYRRSYGNHPTEWSSIDLSDNNRRVTILTSHFQPAIQTTPTPVIATKEAERPDTSGATLHAEDTPAPHTLPKGDPVTITGGKHAGRTGTFQKYCSKVFPEYCRITLDLKPRERTPKTEMIELVHVKKTTTHE